MADAITKSAARCNTGVISPNESSKPIAERIDPRPNRNEILELFRSNGKAEFARTFDWHYAESATPSISWCLRNRDSRVLSGFVSIFERQLRMADEHVRAILSADLMIDKSSRNLGAAVALIRATQSVVRDGQYDVLLARGNESSGRLIERLGFVPIGSFVSHLHLFRSRSKLRRELGLVGIAASPVVDAWSFLARLRHRPAVGFKLVRLDAGHVRRVNMECWQAGSSISVGYLPQELEWRYRDDPRLPASLWALQSPSGSCVAVFAISELRPSEMSIRDIYVDQRYLSDSEAIRLVVDQLPCDLLLLQLLSKSPLARRLTSMGFLHKSSPSRPVMGFWRSDNPLATLLADVSLWSMSPGFNDV